jgi:branched-chain amino acid transport system substrate-binding protein
VRSFARVVAADDVQGAADALMAKQMGVERLFILDDDEAYGQGVASTARRAATQLGIDIAGTDVWDYRDRRYTLLGRKIRGTGADGVFLAGALTANGPQLLTDLRAALGPDVRILAPDGFSDFKALKQDVGAPAEGIVVSVPAVPAERLAPSGRRFVEDFEEAIGGVSSPHAITAAQATQVLLDAIAASDGTRSSVTRNLFRTDVEDGILGDFEIDENGDTTAAGVTMYRMERGRARVLDVITPRASLVG